MRNSLHLLAATALLLLVLSGCSATRTATDWHFGDSLAIRVKETRFVEEVRYLFQGKHYLIQPSQEDRTLAAAHLEIFNREAAAVYLIVNTDAIRLRDENLVDYQALDPFQARIEVEETGPGEDTLKPFIWGDGSDITPVIKLPSKCGMGNLNCQLVGWVLFEVPRDMKIRQLVWDAADTIYLRF